MSTQWENDLIFNIWFTFIRLRLSCTINPRTPIKSKLVAKYFLKNMPKQAVIANF